MANVHRDIFDLLQHSSEFARNSAGQAAELAQQIAALSERLQRPTAIETVHAVVDDLLSVTLRLCNVNLTLARDLDSHADQAVDLMSRALAKVPSHRGGAIASAI